MLDRMLVGIDGSGGAANALRWASAFGAMTGAELLVVTAAATDDPDARQRAVASLADWCAALPDATAAAKTEVLDGDPRVAIPKAAAERDAGLIVVGSSGLGWFPAVHLGHVAHFMALHADRAVAVVPPEFGGCPSSCLAVGIDGSPGSARAVAWAGDVARAIGGKVLAVHARIPSVSRLPETAARDEDPEGAAQEWVRPLLDGGVTVDVDVVDGHPAAALTEQAAGADACLVVVGARGAGGLGGLHIGSVVLRLLHHAQLPVVIVPDRAAAAL